MSACANSFPQKIKKIYTSFLPVSNGTYYYTDQSEIGAVFTSRAECKFDCTLPNLLKSSGSNLAIHPHTAFDL